VAWRERAFRLRVSLRVGEPVSPIVGGKEIGNRAAVGSLESRGLYALVLLIWDWTKRDRVEQRFEQPFRNLWRASTSSARFRVLEHCQSWYWDGDAMHDLIALLD
jgi:hypothetical protein